MLLVDSNDDCRAIYTTILRHGGFAVTVAACADAGLAEARRTPPELVVLSVTPPGDEALRVVRAFRAEPATGGVPLLALSTVPSAHERERLLADGLTAYLAKPCTPLELLAEVRRILAA
ncbi:MAG TPA: response regulator [Longimicrobium sp.]|nr:response regulator [Longimicrobium sp.]